MTIIGWDIGGVNTKAARVENGAVAAVRSRAFELQRDPGKLVEVLRALALEVGAGDAAPPCAVTMTAELSQMFRTKREGVAFVLDAVESAFAAAQIHVFAADGRFLAAADARSAPMAVAAANWSATARLVAALHRDALLVDVGTTTTDNIPIVAGEVVAAGWTDPARLASGELVYTGAVRTPVEAITSSVPFGPGRALVSAEGFALAGDVHVWRGDLTPDDYAVPTPDGRPATRPFAGERLARVICADREMVDEEALSAIAGAIADAQVSRIADAIGQVVARHPSITTAVVTGLGSFIGARAARAAGLRVEPLERELGASAARCAPAACVALLLEQAQSRPAASYEGEVRRTCSPEPWPKRKPDTTYEGSIELVIKVGGSLLAHPDHLDAVLAAIADKARDRPLLIVPGGGILADAIRDVDRRLGLSDDAAHWMAVLAMDQYAELLASRCAGAIVVRAAGEAAIALRGGRVPVLAPSRWLREADPLPHAWSVTSDSIAAWVAGEVGAREIVLVKPPHARGEALMDDYFGRALPRGIIATVVSADRFSVTTARRG